MFSISESGERAEAEGQEEAAIAPAASPATAKPTQTFWGVGVGVDLFRAVPKKERSQARAGPKGDFPPPCAISAHLHIFLLLGQMSRVLERGPGMAGGGLAQLKEHQERIPSEGGNKA